MFGLLFLLFRPLSACAVTMAHIWVASYGPLVWEIWIWLGCASDVCSKLTPILEL